VTFVEMALPYPSSGANVCACIKLFKSQCFRILR
jgi:hypothetical protein